MTNGRPPAAESAYGTWPSPLGAEAIAGGVVGLQEPRVLGDGIYWLESRPTENGRCTLLRRAPDGTVEELTPAPFNLRSRVHEYGGGAYLPTETGVFFVNFVDQRIYRHRAGEITALTSNGPELRFADLEWDTRRQRLMAVTELHGEADEPVNALHAVDGATGTLDTLHSGHDFYAAPRLAPGGDRLAFLHWDHPNMPWDGSQLSVADLTEQGHLGRETVVAGGASESVLQPEWVGTGLLFISDRNGYWNLHRFDASGVYCVLEDAVDYGSPPWVFALRHYAPLDERYVVAARKGPEPEIVLVDTLRGFATPLDMGSEVAGVADLVSYQGTVCALSQFTRSLPALVRHDLQGMGNDILSTSGAGPLDADYVSVPEHLTFPTRDGQAAHAYVYWPHNPDVRAPDGERPPLLVMTHGGPTAATSGSLNLRAQFYTTRGWAVADVNYRGSSGYGRAYRAALDGRWGIIDVQDCEDLVQYLGAAQRIDAERVAIRGGSAGGFTTLAALTTTGTFRAGASHYGIGDLQALARDTHKFESRYLDRLLGDPDALRTRSPIHQVDALACPVIFFQGSEDKVVPPNQSQAMVAALRRKGIPVAYLEFPNEGHGFRSAENIIRAINCEYAFFCRVFGIANTITADLEIENL